MKIKCYRFDCELFEKEVFHRLGFCFAENYTDAVEEIETLFESENITEIKLYEYDSYDGIILDTDINNSYHL